MAIATQFLSLRLIVIIGLAVAVAMPFADAAFSQAGSLGGTLGQTDKSLSGQRQDEPRTPPKAAPRPKPSIAPKPSAATKVFHNPSIGGVRLDVCLHFSTECNEPAASAWCRSHGFTRASAWNIETVSPTVLPDGQTCSAGFCHGFTTILCE
jgi:hypothetical protein